MYHFSQNVGFPCFSISRSQLLSMILRIQILVTEKHGNLTFSLKCWISLLLSIPKPASQYDSVSPDFGYWEAWKSNMLFEMLNFPASQYDTEKQAFRILRSMQIWQIGHWSSIGGPPRNLTCSKLIGTSIGVPKNWGPSECIYLYIYMYIYMYMFICTWEGGGWGGGPS